MSKLRSQASAEIWDPLPQLLYYCLTSWKSLGWHPRQSSGSIAGYTVTPLLLMCGAGHLQPHSLQSRSQFKSSISRT